MVVEFENNQHNVQYRCTPIHTHFVQSHECHAALTKTEQIFGEDIPLCTQFNTKTTKAINTTTLLQPKLVSYKKLQHVSANRSASGEVNTKYTKDSMIKLTVFYNNFA